MSDPPPASWDDPDVWVERDAQGRLRHLRHLVAPLPYDIGLDDRMVAHAYLTAHADQAKGYGLSPDQLAFLHESRADHAKEPTEAGVWFGWLPTRNLPHPEGGTANVAVVPLEQFRLDRKDGVSLKVTMPEAGVRVVIRRRVGADGSALRPEVISSNSTARYDPPDRMAEDAAEIGALTELYADREQFLARITAAVQQVMAQVGLETVSGSGGVRFFQPDISVMSRPTVHGRSLASNLAIEVGLMARPAGTQPENTRPGCELDGAVGYRVVLDLDDGALRVVSIRAQVASCTGQAYPLDPASASGNLAIRPNLRAPTLNALRKEVPLRRRRGTSSRDLSGDLVRLADPGRLGIRPPKAGFRASARTDDFAAVSAYHHCDCMFALALDFGFDETNLFFPHTPPSAAAKTKQFPVIVAHRAAMTLMEPPTDRSPYTDAQVFTVNAQVVGGAGICDGQDASTLVAEMRFALGDLADGPTTPLPGVSLADGVQGAFGAAADPRWAWHEFGHALIVAATGSLELPFAHSVGDALAAIMSDPDSEFARPRHGALRGVTFPFVWQPLRRHDRDPAQGWSWHGTLHPPAYPDPRDPGGYAAEEILSSTLFRLYRALGGDAMLGVGAGEDDEPDRPRRRAAADYVAYLIMRAVASLGPAAAVPSTPGVFATALMAADADTGLFTHGGQQRCGGAVRKVVRWAFEQQGLYPPAGTAWPQNGPGVPEAVDVFVDDGRGGDYAYTSDWRASQAALRLAPPAAAANVARPVAGSAQHLWVRIGNRGTTLAAGVTVTAYATTGADCDTWNRTRWAALPPAAGPADIPPGASVEAGPFAWTPTGGGRHAVLFAVDAPGDRSVLYQPSGLACAAGPTPVVDLVPFDNNLAYFRWDL